MTASEGVCALGLHVLDENQAYTVRHINKTAYAHLKTNSSEGKREVNTHTNTHAHIKSNKV